MTSTPALAFAADEAGSEGPALAYASVAPLCQIFPIVVAVILALALRSFGSTWRVNPLGETPISERCYRD